MTVIGSAYVNIRAITDKLEVDIRKTIESIKDTVTIKVDADVSAATAKIAQIADSISDQTITVNADTAEAQARLDELAHTALGDQTVRVNADTAIARAEFDNMVDDMGHQSPTITPNINDALARLRLAMLTHRRSIEIDVKTNSASFRAIGGFLARLSGARVATENVKSLIHEFSNIDKMVPAISKAAIKMGTIGAAAISSVGGIMTLGASLGNVMAMVGIAAPGMIAGFAVGMGTLMVALKDFSKQLPGVTAQYKGLAAVVRGNFWANAREPIRDMAESLFPQMSDGIASVSGSLGTWAAKLAGALKAGLSNGVLRTMFENLAVSIDVAGNANKPFVDSMLTLGKVGSALLPRLAQWWVDINNQFNKFIKTAEANGSLTRWVNEGLADLKRLWEVLTNTAGIFSGITAAAHAAGSDGLGTILSFVERLNKAINSPEGMKALTTIFQGAGTASSALGDGVFQILQSVGTAAPALKSAFESVGGVITLVAGAISTIISNPAFQKGFANMFKGIEEGAGKLLPVLGTTGPKIGELLSIIGNLASNLGGILGKALEVTLPLITAFKKAIDPLIPILGDALVKIIAELGPTFTILASAISDNAPAIADFVKGVSDIIVGLVHTLGPALPGITAAIIAGVAAFRTFSVISGFITGMANVAKALGLVEVAQTLLNVAMKANVIGLIVTAIAALVAGVIVAYNNIGWFKDFVDGAFKGIQDIIGAVVNWFNNEFVPMWDGAAKAAGDFFGGIGKWVGEAAANIGKFVTDAGKGIADFFGGIGGMAGDGANAFGGFFDGIGKGISDAFNGAVDFVNTAIAGIGAAIAVPVQAIVAAWGTAWQGITDFFKRVWDGLVYIYGPVVELLLTVIGGFIEIITTIWQVGWEIITTIFVGVWNKIVEFITPIIQMIVDFISNGINGLVTWWNTTWQLVSDFFASVWNGIVAFIAPIVQSIVDTITSVLSGISATWNAVWDGISSFFISIWNNMVAFYGPILSGIWNFIVSTVNNISAGWNAAWSAISSFFSGIWNGIVSFISGVISGIQARIGQAMAYIQAVWGLAWGIIKSVVSGVWTNITTIVGNIVSTVQQKIGEVVSFFTGLPGKVTSALSSFAGDMITVGRNVVQGLIDGAKGMINNAVQAIKDVGGAMLGGIKDFLGIHSPSREFIKIGTWITVGLANGITAGGKSVVKTMLTLAQRITDVATQHFKNAQSKSVIKAGKANWEIQQGRYLDQVAGQVRAQTYRLSALADQRTKLAAKLKTAQGNVDKILATRNKEASKVQGNLRGEMKLSNFVGMDAKDIVAGANAVAARIRTFGTKIAQLRALGLSATLISEVAGLGSEDGTMVADSLISGGKGQVAGLNAAYKSIDASAKSTGLSVANGMYGAGINAAQGLANGLRKNIAAVDAAARSIGNRLIAQVKKTLGIRSPSRVMRDQVGMQIGAGLAQGIRNSIALVSSATDDLMAAATPDPTSLVFGSSNSGPVLTTGSVTPAGATSAGLPTTGNSPFGTGQFSGGVNLNVYPSAGMDEVAVGKAAVRELNWQLISM